MRARRAQDSNSAERSSQLSFANNPRHGNLQSSVDCDSLDDVICFEGPSGHDSYGCVYYSDGPTSEVYAGEGSVYAVSELDGHIYQQVDTSWKDLGGEDCEMFAVSGSTGLYCLSSNGISQMASNGYTLVGPDGWFLMNDPDIHSHAEFIVAADYYHPIAAMMDSLLPGIYSYVEPSEFPSGPEGWVGPAPS